MSRLAEKVAIITGGAGGIGAATAHELAREGAAVAVVDIDETKANDVADKIRRTGARAIALGGDLAQEDTARSVVAATIREFGRVDVLHNNADRQQLFVPRHHRLGDAPRCVAAVNAGQPRKSAADVQVCCPRNA